VRLLLLLTLMHAQASASRAHTVDRAADGVVQGHYRTSLAGVDLNRQWFARAAEFVFARRTLTDLLLIAQDRSEQAGAPHCLPRQAGARGTLCAARWLPNGCVCVRVCGQVIRQLRQEREVLLACDFHGHTRKPNIFAYGSSPNARPSREHSGDRVAACRL
jgi:hypothetical protein